jgi:hypothetical protein
VYSEKTADDGQRNCPKHVELHSKNKFEKLVHLVGFIIRNLTHICFVHNYTLTTDGMSAALIPDKQCSIQLPTVTPALPGWQPSPFHIAT